MRISDWSSDVCSSDLPAARSLGLRHRLPGEGRAGGLQARPRDGRLTDRDGKPIRAGLTGDRKSVVEGKSVSVRVDLGGRRIIQKKNKKTSMHIQTHNKEKTEPRTSHE